MASRIKPAKGIDPKTFHSDLAEFVLQALAKHTPHRNFGRVRDPGRGFYKLASKTFARVVSSYYFFSAWNNGRKKVKRPRDKPMVYFPNIEDDPRVTDDYPRTPGKRRSLRTLLSDEEFRRMRKEGTLRITTRTKAVKGENFVKPALVEARKNIRAAGIGEIQKSARDIIKQVRSARGLTYFTLM